MSGSRWQLLLVFGICLALFAPAAQTSHLFPGAASNLQGVMTAGGTSTVNTTMSLSTTSVNGLNSTVSGNNSAIFAYSSGANGLALSVENDNGSTEAQFFRFGSSANNGALILGRDASTGGSTGPLLDLQDGAGATDRFVVGRAGSVTVPTEVSWAGVGTDGTGKFRQSSQTGTISATTTSTAVTFGATFAATPTSVQVTPTSNPGTTLWWVSAITTTGFTLNETAGTTISYTYTATE